MRIKNDTCIKSYQLANTMNLTNEEFGALVRMIMIEDDKQEHRYDEIPETAAVILAQYEEEWKQDFQRLLKDNGMVLQGYVSMGGQISKSRKAFEQKQKYYEEKDQEEEEETKPKKKKKVSAPEPPEPKEDPDFWEDENGGIAFNGYAQEIIGKEGYSFGEVADYIYQNKDRYRNTVSIDDVMIDMNKEQQAQEEYPFGD